MQVLANGVKQRASRCSINSQSTLLYLWPPKLFTAQNLRTAIKC